MTGTLTNAAAVILGSLIGVSLNKKMPERIKGIYFQAIGLFSLALGIHMSYNMEHILIIVISLTAGSILGECCNIDGQIEKISEKIKQQWNVGNSKFSDGLISSFLLFCVGSMTIIGAIQEGTTGSPDLLFTKSLMDGFSAVLLASAFGFGVFFSAIPLLIFQGGLTLFAMYAQSLFVTDTIQILTNIGGILLIGLGINILEIKKIKIINMIPSLLIVVLALWINNKFLHF